MSTALPALALASYHFDYQTEDPLALAEPPFALWHGVFGMQLRRLACVTRQPHCEGCLLLYQCPYSLLFSGPRPPGAELMRRYQRIPVPHCFQLAGTHPPRLAAGAPLRVTLVLIGSANAQVALVSQAMAAAGAAGLGAGRARLRLERVEQCLPDGSPARPVLADGRWIGAPAPPVMPPLPPWPDPAAGSARLRLCFHSPYKAGDRGRSGAPTTAAAATTGLDSGLDLGRLLMAIVRRVSLLQAFYGGERLEAAFPALKAASSQVEIVASDLQYQRSSRYAAGKGRRVDTSGLRGELILAGPGLALLWPFLHLGQWLNVGKNASMGFGCFTIAPLPNDQ